MRVTTIILFCILTFTVRAQVMVCGRVLGFPDSVALSNTTILNRVTVSYATTDNDGRFCIYARSGDSISFSHLGFMPVTVHVYNLKQRLDVLMPASILTLRQVEIEAHSFRRDSAKTRADYKKYFQYHPVEFNDVVAGGGISIDAVIESFQFRKNQRKQSFHKLLLRDEMERYIATKFTPGLVMKITGESDSAMVASFMEQNSPGYLMVKEGSDYDLYMWTKDRYAAWLSSGRQKVFTSPK